MHLPDERIPTNQIGHLFEDSQGGNLGVDVVELVALFQKRNEILLPNLELFFLGFVLG